MLPGRFRQKALEIKATTNVSSATLSQMSLAEYLRQGRMDRHLKRLRVALETQMDIMQMHLGRHFPEGTRVTHPTGGAVLWLELPHNINAVELFFQARSKGVGIAPGAAFSTQDKFSNYIRICYGVPWSNEVECAIKTLGDLAKHMNGN